MESSYRFKFNDFNEIPMLQIHLQIIIFEKNNCDLI